MSLLHLHGLPLAINSTFNAAGSDTSSLLNFNAYNLLAGFIFGTIGWGAFMYGKRLELWQPRAIGVALMVYPYLVSNNILVWVIGVGLLVLLWFYHYE